MMDFGDCSPGVLREFMQFMTGDQLGSGMSRTVFDHPHDRTKVIKMEDSITQFQNVREWEFWLDCAECPDVKRWLAPCYSISHSGTFLIMAKTTPLTAKQIPKTLPEFLTDHKAENFGMLDGKVVCHDYGRIIHRLGMRPRKWRGCL